jgi:hypothetical protein
MARHANAGFVRTTKVVGMGMRSNVAALAGEAQQQIHDHLWELAANDRVLALDAEEGLRKAIGPPEVQQALPLKDRLEDLREALAVLALCLARTHGPLAWFLSGAITALESVLRWRAVSPGHGPTFGTVQASPGDYAEAEDAIRLLQKVLAQITAEFPA